jgi:hypothetical protein
MTTTAEQLRPDRPVRLPLGRRIPVRRQSRPELAAAPQCQPQNRATHFALRCEHGRWHPLVQVCEADSAASNRGSVGVGAALCGTEPRHANAAELCGALGSARPQSTRRPPAHEITPVAIEQYRSELEAQGVGQPTISGPSRCSKESFSARLNGSGFRGTRSSSCASRKSGGSATCDRCRRPPSSSFVSPAGTAPVQGDRNATLSVLAYAGLRPQEALALTWATFAIGRS